MNFFYHIGRRGTQRRIAKIGEIAKESKIGSVETFITEDTEKEEIEGGEWARNDAIKEFK